MLAALDTCACIAVCVVEKATLTASWLLGRRCPTRPRRTSGRACACARGTCWMHPP